MVGVVGELPPRAKSTKSATLAKAGFKDIYHLTGGIAAWRGAGLPVEK